MRTYGKAVAILLAFVLVMAFPVAAAIRVPSPTERFFVNDYADVLDASAEQTIYAAGVQLFERTQAQAVVVTVDTMDGVAIEDYTLALAREWGIGNGEDDTGVLLFLAVQDREARIEVGYGLEGAITDTQSGIILDTYAMDAFSQNDFQSGLVQAYDAIVNEVYLEFGIQADPNYTPVETLEEQNQDSPLAMIVWIVMIVAILILFSRRGPGIRFLPIFFGHHHGGGFGGGFGGGGFGGGGFSGGGGGFGGGGASRRF